MSSTTFFFFFIPLLAFILLGVNFLFAPHNPYQKKDDVFECGFSSFLGQNRTQFTVSFFIFALIFLIFDLEILLVYPYIVSAYTNSIYGLLVMLIFFIILTLGFVFELGKKALNIESRQVFTLSNHNFRIINKINLKTTKNYNIFRCYHSKTSLFKTNVKYISSPHLLSIFALNTNNRLYLSNLSSLRLFSTCIILYIDSSNSSRVGDNMGIGDINPNNENQSANSDENPSANSDENQYTNSDENQSANSDIDQFVSSDDDQFVFNDDDQFVNRDISHNNSDSDSDHYSDYHNNYDSHPYSDNYSDSDSHHYPDNISASYHSSRYSSVDPFVGERDTEAYQDGMDDKLRVLEPYTDVVLNAEQGDPEAIAIAERVAPVEKVKWCYLQDAIEDSSSENHKRYMRGKSDVIRAFAMESSFILADRDAEEEQRVLDAEQEQRELDAEQEQREQEQSEQEQSEQEQSEQMVQVQQQQVQQQEQVQQIQEQVQQQVQEQVQKNENEKDTEKGEAKQDDKKRKRDDDDDDNNDDNNNEGSRVRPRLSSPTEYVQELMDCEPMDFIDPDL